MNADLLGDQMRAAIDALTDEGKRDRTAVFRALAAAIVDHIRTADITVTSVSGVTVGAGVSGPGTGTIT